MVLCGGLVHDVRTRNNCSEPNNVRLTMGSLSLDVACCYLVFSVVHGTNHNQ
jgi:hypothetical protein